MLGVLLAALVLAQGVNFSVTLQDVVPYKEAFFKRYGHYPRSRDERMEVLMNCIADKLILKRAEELKVSGRPDFKKVWSEMEVYINKRCSSEGLSPSRCLDVKRSFLKIAKIRYVLQKEVYPEALKKAEEESWLVDVHGPLRKKVPKERLEGFIKESSKLKALSSYIEKLMKIYKVKINEEALDKL